MVLKNKSACSNSCELDIFVTDSFFSLFVQSLVQYFAAKIFIHNATLQCKIGINFLQSCFWMNVNNCSLNLTAIAYTHVCNLGLNYLYFNLNE